MRPVCEALSVRTVLAIAGRGAAEPAPPAAWTGAGSRVLQALRRAAAALGPAAARCARPVDTVAAALAARPALTCAALAVALPVVRLTLPPAAATATACALLALLLLTVALALCAALHADPADRRVVLRVIVLGALLRLVFGALIAARGGFPDETSTYFPIAADAARSWTFGAPSILSEHLYVLNRPAYFYPLSAAFLLTGPALATGRVLGAFFGLLAAVVGGEVARHVAGRRAAVFAVALLALHPEHAFWNATLSRDGLSVLLVLTTLAALTRRPGRLTRGGFVPALVCLALLWWNSFLVAVCLGATLSLTALCEGIADARRGAGGAVRAAGAVAAALLALVATGYRFGPYMTPEVLSNVRSLGVGARPDFLPGLAYTSWLEVGAFAPLGALYSLAAPLPWNAVHAQRAAYAVLALPGLALTLCGVVGLGALLKKAAARAAPLALFCLIALAALAVIEGVDGIVVRHRMPLTAVLTVAAAALFAGLRPRATTGAATGATT